MSKIYEIFGDDAHKMTISLLEAADVRSLIPAGAGIVLKPNLVLAAPADEGATTHPGVVSGCIEYLQKNGFRDISVIEGSWIGDKTDRASRTNGLDQVCKEYGVPFFDLKKDDVKTIDTPLRPMRISRRAAEAGYFIDLPVLKGHCQTNMTCALKNLKGCLPDSEKRQFHSEGLMRPIAALAAALKPDLIIVDSICGDLDFEEGGNPVRTNRMYLGTDPVQIDVYGCRLMGLELDDVPYIKMAEEWGAGSACLSDTDIISLNDPRNSASYPAASGKVKQLTKNVRADSACSACYASLVRGLYVVREEGIRVDQPVYIGQGYDGKKLRGIGIGKCCAGADRCVKGCPPTAEAVARTLRDQ